MNFIIVKNEEYRFNSKVDTFSVSGSESDCFDKIKEDIELEKVKWSNITDKNRRYEIQRTDDKVELKVYQNSSVHSNIVCTVNYKIKMILSM
jgi:hypothetical protein